MNNTFGRPPAIILVDDEPEILIILHRNIREITKEYEIIPVTNGAEALAHIGLRHVPLVITDYKLPGMDGLQLTKATKEQSPNSRVVLITAYATPELERRAREHQVDYYLPKPFPLAQLEQIVRDVIARQSTIESVSNTAQYPEETLPPASQATMAEVEHMYTTVQHYYQIVGAPYGSNYSGMMRWVEERLSGR